MFATAEQMSNRTRGAITAATHPFLTAELEAATALIRSACGWHVAPRQELTFEQEGSFPADVWLPAMQITAITAVTVDGETVPVDSVRFNPRTGWTNLRGCAWSVTYEAGFDTPPADLVTLTLQIAARSMSSPTGVTREQIGQHSVSFALTSAQASGGTVLLPVEREQLAPYVLGWLP